MDNIEYLLVRANKTRLDPFPLLKEIVNSKKFEVIGIGEFSVKLINTEDVYMPIVSFINETYKKQILARSGHTSDLMALGKCLQTLYSTGWNEPVKKSFAYEVLTLSAEPEKKQTRKKKTTKL